MPASPLFNPDGFFQEHPEPSLLPPIVILIVLSLVFTVLYEGVLFGLQNTRSLLFEFPDLVLINLLIGIVSGVISFGLYWIGYTVFFYLVSLVFDGEGRFKRLFAYFGWALFPSLLGMVGLGLVLLGLFPDGIIAAEGDDLFIEEFTALSGVLLRTIQAMSVLVTLWMAYILVYALKHGRNLTRREAAIAVGVPIGLQFIGWFIFQYFYFPDLMAVLR